MGYCANISQGVSNVRLKVDNIQTGQTEMRADIKDLGNKTDNKFDKTDNKIDRIFYGVITTLVGFVLKGGFDYYQAAKQALAQVTAVESIHLKRLVTD